MSAHVETATVAATATVKEAVPHYTLRLIDSLAAGRNNFIEVVHPTGNKKPGSIAERNYPLYGAPGKPTVTVANFMKNYPTVDGGVTRARSSLLWDLQRKFVKITHPDTVPPAEPIDITSIADLDA